MGADYIPERDHRAGCWMKFFARALVADAAAYRATVAEAEAVAAAVLAFRTAMAVAWAFSTRTHLNVRLKNAARKAAERLIRPVAQRVRVDSSIAPALKYALGLRVTAAMARAAAENVSVKRRRVIGPPAGVPVLSIRSVRSGVVELVAVDSNSPHRRARPRAAAGLELFERVHPAGATMAAVNAAPSAEEVGTGWRFLGTFTRAAIRVRPRVRGTGTLVELVARWVTRRGEAGALGRAVATVVNAGIAAGGAAGGLRSAA